MLQFIVRGSVHPGKEEEFAQKWRGCCGARIREMPEFEQAYLSADRATGVVLNVVLWNTMPDEAELRQNMQALAAQTADLVTGPTTVEWLEVLQHL